MPEISPTIDLCKLYAKYKTITEYNMKGFLLDPSTTVGMGVKLIESYPREKNPFRAVLLRTK